MDDTGNVTGLLSSIMDRFMALIPPERILHQFASILCPPSLEREEVKHEVAPVIEVEQLTKCFGDFTAVDHISFVNRGEIFGFLGANGAGKDDSYAYALRIKVNRHRASERWQDMIFTGIPNKLRNISDI